MDFTLVPNKKIIVKSFNNWFKLDVFKAALIADCQLIAVHSHIHSHLNCLI